MGKSESVNRRGIDNTMTKGKRTNNDLQNNTHQPKDRVTRTPLKTGGGLRCSGRVAGPVLLVAPVKFRHFPLSATCIILTTSYWDL